MTAAHLVMAVFKALFGSDAPAANPRSVTTIPNALMVEKVTYGKEGPLGTGGLTMVQPPVGKTFTPDVIKRQPVVITKPQQPPVSTPPSQSQRRPFM